MMAGEVPAGPAGRWTAGFHIGGDQIASTTRTAKRWRSCTADVRGRTAGEGADVGRGARRIAAGIARLPELMAGSTPSDRQGER
jgi:hypothetical protein